MAGNELSLKVVEQLLDVSPLPSIFALIEVDAVFIVQQLADGFSPCANFTHSTTSRPGLTLDRARRQTLDDAPLENQHQNNQRDGHNDRRR